MTDRELLELAAKAAGYEHIDFLAWDDGDALANVYSADGAHHLWNPLTSDGDALRMAVKLRLECVYPANGDDKCVCQYWICNEGFEQVIEEINGDPYAATRRAIVRAAAEIGRNMK